MKIDIDELFQIALNAANDAKNSSIKYIIDSKIISHELKDIKTMADIEMNNIIISHLKLTGIPILSEESEKKHHNGYIWIVDPLDGTLNFSRGYGCYSISISLWNDDTPLIGIVYDIFNNQVYTSKKSKGTFLGTKSLHVSNTNQLQDAILATGFSSGANYHTDSLYGLVKQVQIFKKVRAIGSASIMLSYVASGVFDVYYEKDIYLWDIAAGLSLVKESGGKFIIRKTDDKFKYEVLASNKLLFNECRNIFMS